MLQDTNRRLQLNSQARGLVHWLSHTNKCTVIYSASLKFTLKTFKSSYILRSPSGSVHCSLLKLYVKKRLKSGNYVHRWCGSMSVYCVPSREVGRLCRVTFDIRTCVDTGILTKHDSHNHILYFGTPYTEYPSFTLIISLILLHILQHLYKITVFMSGFQREGGVITIWSKQNAVHT